MTLTDLLFAAFGIGGTVLICYLASRQGVPKADLKEPSRRNTPEWHQWWAEHAPSTEAWLEYYAARPETDDHDAQTKAGLTGIITPTALRSGLAQQRRRGHVSESDLAELARAGETVGVGRMP